LFELFFGRPPCGFSTLGLSESPDFCVVHVVTPLREELFPFRVHATLRRQTTPAVKHSFANLRNANPNRQQRSGFTPPPPGCTLPPMLSDKSQVSPHLAAASVGSLEDVFRSFFFFIRSVPLFIPSFFHDLSGRLHSSLSGTLFWLYQSFHLLDFPLLVPPKLSAFFPVLLIVGLCGFSSCASAPFSRR